MASCFPNLLCVDIHSVLRQRAAHSFSGDVRNIIHAHMSDTYLGTVILLVQLMLQSLWQSCLLLCAKDHAAHLDDRPSFSSKRMSMTAVRMSVTGFGADRLADISMTGNAGAHHVPLPVCVYPWSRLQQFTAVELYKDLSPVAAFVLSCRGFPESSLRCKLLYKLLPLCSSARMIKAP